MDSGDLEREKGITILAKNTAVHYAGPAGRRQADDDQHHRHPRPRRLRRRGRARPVDGRRHRAAGRRQRGPAAADPVRAAQGAQRRHAGRARGQQGRPRRRPDRRGRRRDLRAVHGPARRQPQPGRARLPGRLRLRPRPASRSLEQPENGAHARRRRPRAAVPTILETIPAPTYVEGAPLQAHVTNLDASPFLGRLALLRVHQGTLQQGPERRVDAAATARSRTSGSPSSSSPRASSASPASRPGPATSSRSPASPRSPSARRWPTRRTRSRCRSSTSTSRPSR